MADIKISELEPTTDLEGLYTIGADKNNLSKKVSLQFLKDAANYANEQGDYAKQAGDTVNGNVGVSDYPEFSASQSYVIGDIVRYNGVLYSFTANHAASAWNGSDVKATSINAITSGKLTELELKLGTYDSNPEYIRAYTDVNGVFIWGIKADGSIEWAKGVPTPIREYVKEADRLNENELERLNQLILDLVTQFTELGMSYESNPEYIQVDIDANGKVLGGYDVDGKKHLARPTNQDDFLQEQINEKPSAEESLTIFKAKSDIKNSLNGIPRNFYANLPSRDNAFNQIWTLVNGIGMYKDFAEKQFVVPTNKFSHDSVLVSDGNRLYCVYVRNDVNNGDAADNPNAYIAMSIVEKDTFKEVKTIEIAKNGTPINGQNVKYGCGTPNAYLVNLNTIRILFNGALTDGIGYLFYIDYSISNDSLGSIGICTLTIDGQQYPFSDKTLKDIYNIEPWNGVLSLNADIGYDSNSKKYYAGLNLLNRITNSIIVDSENLIDFNIWTIPQFTNECHAEYEGACVVWKGKLFYALRQDYKYQNLLIAVFNLQTKEIEKEIMIPDCGSRPSWVIQDDYRLNLFHGLSSRGLMEVVEFYSADINNSFVIAQIPISDCVYPSVIKLDNAFYFSASYNVKIFSCSNFIKVSEHDLINRLFTFLN